jgi:predicted dehydrogenase
MIDLMLLIARQRPVSVFAQGRAACLGEILAAGELSSSVQHDYMTAVLSFRYSLVAKVTANFGSVTPHHHRLVVYGTKGTAIIDDMGLRMCFERDSPHTTFTPSTLSTKPEKGALIPAFVGAVRTGSGWPQTQRYFDGLSIVFACEESLRKRKEVGVEYV